MSVRPAGPPERATAPRVLASVPWILVLLGVVTLVTILLVASLSFRGREPEPVAASVPPLVLPTPPAASPSSSPSTSRPAAEARPSRTATRTSPSARASSRAPATQRSSPQAALLDGGAVSVTYRVRDADRDDVEAELLVENDTGRAEEWTVTLEFSGGVRRVKVVSGGSGVSLTSRGDGRYVLAGTSPLASGASVELGLYFSRHDRDDTLARCAVNGNDCIVD
ncbi:hypothetical protein [Micromonospora sp. WMMD812]|uniref:hypothetical protein n=1 Tax=Micromonospora sp. WMMD812 TaxID=3015152 RepID=UPI00248B9BD3|nr:hypothetical protein [Micromonospora sp. WMMD812]WBB67453.1 hypothetical protein O7603_30955 [Micromonospora sp. WMMD812]